MTKEECLKALETLQDKYLNFDVVDELICFKSLIEEHFDNPPLKFEELKECMWVWDNKEKTYIKSCNNYDTKEHGKGIRVQIGFDLVRINYEENRFYRKQVEDE